MSLNWLWWLNIFLAVLVLIFWAFGVSIPASDLSTTSGESQNGLNSATNDSVDVGKIVFHSDRDGNPEIYIMYADGSVQTRLTNHPLHDMNPSISKDGKKVAFLTSRYDPDAANNFPLCNFEIHVINTDGSNEYQLTDMASFAGFIDWSPDGAKLVFQADSGSDGHKEIYVIDSDGDNLTRLTNNSCNDVWPDWSPDNLKIAFCSDRDGNYEIYRMNIDGSNQQRITNNNSMEGMPRWSPDGSQIAFMSDRAGYQAIWVMNADGTNARQLTNQTDRFGECPAWSPDGERIAYHAPKDNNYEICAMDSDGSNHIILTNHAGNDMWPDWGVAREPMNKYLGQTPPDSIPEIFAPGMVSTPEGAEYTCAFTPDGTEFYFTRYDQATSTNNIWVTRLSYNQWTSPALASFNQGYSYNIEPCISPDGQKLFFISARPAGAPPSIWYVDRIDTGWLDPQVIEELLSGVVKWGPSVATNGNLYFCQHEGNRIQIYMSRYNGVYETPVKLGEEINHFYIAGHPFVAPDEDYLLFDACPNCPTSEEDYLYISFKRPDDGWYPAIKLNNLINATDIQYCPSVSPDGEYLFFSRGDQDIYWVDTEALCISGDADINGSIDISDVIYLINYLFRGGPEPVPWIAGDSNNDGEVSVSDVIYLINYLFKEGPKPSC